MLTSCTEGHKMNAYEIRNLVTNELKAVQEISGRKYTQLDQGDKPLEKLDGFDSLIGVEATALIESRIGCEIPRDSLFISANGKRASTMAEIFNYLENLVNASDTQYRSAA